MWLVVKGLLAYSLLSTDEPMSKAEQTIKKAFIIMRVEKADENKTIRIDKRSVMGVCLLLYCEWMSEWVSKEHVFVCVSLSYN